MDTFEASQRRKTAWTLSCADSSFPRLSHEAALAVIQDLSIPAVDICVYPGGHTEPDAVRVHPLAAAERVAKLVDRAGLAISDVFMILGFEEFAINHPDADVRSESLDYFISAVRFASSIGSTGLTILPGMPFANVESDVNMRLAATQLQRRALIAGEAGLALSVEPHFGSIADTPSTATTLLELAPAALLTLDYSHFVYQGISQVDVDFLIPKARHMHLRQAGEGAMQLPTNEGLIDFPKLIGQLERFGYRGYLCLEYQWEEWLDCRRVDCISETAELRNLVLATTSVGQQ